MRALPILVDLFVLLTVFALVLFFAAFGNSAPNEVSSQLTVIEVEAELLGGAKGRVSGFGAIVFRPELVDASGSVVDGDFSELDHPNPARRRFLIRTAPDGTLFRMVATSISPQAFDSEQLLMRIERIYPGMEMVGGNPWSVGSAGVLEIGVN